ncbi:MAG TPA: hypothetical protein PLZ47_02965 [Candidatus Cloacimonas acidaminovorans]|nr:hypothetical protein [Candidatus Cloacimonas acidaminovorans]HOM79031.1 hypothetical protein [Candidatus Cloacimonas acidaminovorans]
MLVGKSVSNQDNIAKMGLHSFFIIYKIINPVDQVNSAICFLFMYRPLGLLGKGKVKRKG